MKYYPNYQFNTPILECCKSECCKTAVAARDYVMCKKLGISVKDLYHLLDDKWCNEHRESVARILDIRCDRDDFVEAEHR